MIFSVALTFPFTLVAIVLLPVRLALTFPNQLSGTPAHPIRIDRDGRTGQKMVR